MRRGFSHHIDARRAAVELHDAIAQPDTAFVLVFCSPQYDLPVLGEALADVFGETLVIGCTTAGEITPAGYMTGSITGVSFPRSDFTAVAERIDDLEKLRDRPRPGADPKSDRQARRRLSRTSRRCVQQLRPAPDRRLVDPGGPVVSSLYSALGDIPLFGGSAGDDLKFEQTWVLHDGRFHTDAAVLVLIDTGPPLHRLPHRAFRQFRP